MLWLKCSTTCDTIKDEQPTAFHANLRKMVAKTLKKNSCISAKMVRTIISPAAPVIGAPVAFQESSYLIGP